MSELRPLPGDSTSRSGRLDRALSDLVTHAPEIEAAAVVSFDGLPMVSALPPSMDEDRVAAMSAALLSLGERAAEGLGRGELSQVYIEGEAGTVFLVSCDNEAVLVAVAAAGAKVGMMLYEVRRASAVVARVLREEDAVAAAQPQLPVQHPAPVPTVAPSVYLRPAEPEPTPQPAASAVPGYAPVPVLPVEPAPQYNGAQNGHGWSSYAPGGGGLPGEPTPWS